MSAPEQRGDDVGEVVPFRGGPVPVERPDTSPEAMVFDAEPVEPELVDVDGDGNPDVFGADGSRWDSIEDPEPSDEDAGTAMVDTRGSGLPAVRATAERREIVPSWLKSRQDATATVGVVLVDVWHRVRFHTIRAPYYSVRVAARSPRGAYRVVRGVGRYAFALESVPLRNAAVRAGSTEEYLRLTREHQVQVRRRVWVTVPAAAATLTGVLLLVVAAPGWLVWLVLVLVVLGLGAAGRVVDKPVVSRAVVRTAAPPLTAASVEAALGALGITNITQALAKGRHLNFSAPITRDGPGWRADLDLPLGVVPGDIMEKREELASGLRRKLGCVWPSPDPTQHAGRLIIWVGDQDMASTKKPAWPLAKTGQADLFKPLPFGTDQRGRMVAVTLMFASMVVGSISRMGKTFSVRLLLLGAALDPIAELHTYDLKGTGDFSALEPVAHAYRAGDDDDDVAYAMADMTALAEEVRRRTKVIRELPKHRCPENKITPELAADRSLGLHPIVLGVDECQRWFEHEKYGKDLEKIAEDLVRRGPAAGITAIFATQRPDAKSLPTGISGNAVLRFCLKVMGHTANDQVLGTSAHKNGIKATIFSRSDLGIGWLSGEGDDPQVTRTYCVDNPAAEQIVIRARAIREAAGTLSGHAIGVEPEPDQATALLDHLVAVLAPSDDRVWSEVLADRLAEHYPTHYGELAALESGAKASAFASMLKPHGITTEQVHGRLPDGKPANRRGVVAEHIRDAYVKRLGPGTSDPEGSSTPGAASTPGR